MLLRDRLLARLNEMGKTPDYVRLAAEVLGIQNTPPALAKRLVEQALVVEDRREAWLRRGEQICQAAPSLPGVYVLRDDDGRALYVGKANNLRRRLRTHFAARRWRSVKAKFARATHAEWRVVGSEIEALVREAALIRRLAPAVNVQVGTPHEDGRAVPAAIRRDTVVVLPSAVEGAVELLAVRMSGPVAQVRVRRDGTGLRAAVTRVWQFFQPGAWGDDERISSHAGDTALSQDGRPSSAGGTTHASASEQSQEHELPQAFVVADCAPLVWTWLTGRGSSATRLDPHDATGREFERRVRLVLRDDSLFSNRIVVLRSGRRTRAVDGR